MYHVAIFTGPQQHAVSKRVPDHLPHESILICLVFTVVAGVQAQQNSPLALGSVQWQLNWHCARNRAQEQLILYITGISHSKIQYIHGTIEALPHLNWGNEIFLQILQRTTIIRNTRKGKTNSIYPDYARVLNLTFQWKNVQHKWGRNRWATLSTNKHTPMIKICRGPISKTKKLVAFC